jgi:hypothetical protein
VGTGIAVSSATQPLATLAPESAARVPFTKVTLTAGTDGDIVVNGINVERTGLANDAVFAGIVLLDETGSQIGISKTLNSNHQATVGDAFTVKAGQSKTITIGGNMVAALDNYSGQVAYLSVTGISTSATVSGTLPITGAGHTINASLALGSVTNARGPLDPNGAQSKEIGTTGYTFSSVKFTAGSAEKVRVKSIRWNQSGSAAASDLANVKTYVDGTAYDTVVSSDGKYYTSTFGNGIVVDKGNSIEVYIKGDIVGGSGRTIAFDLYKTTDVYITGETFGYGITPPTTGTPGLFGATTPWYNASDVTVSSGTLTVTKATAVGAQNIAINLANQPLGGFVAEAKGEAISVAQTVFNIATSIGTGTGLLTNVSIFDENGSAVAGPVDATYVSPTVQRVTFTDTVTFPTGAKTYTIKGKLPSTIGNDTTFIVSTTPSTDWTTVTGQTTGNSITPSSALVTMNTMTAKAAATAITVSADPVAQTVVAGAQGWLFANYQFDASASGEDVRFNSLALQYTHASGSPDYLTNCQLYDGTALNTGSNAVNPASTHVSLVDSTFTLDSGLVVSKQTVKTIALKCNISASANGKTYKWGLQTAPTGTGLTSGQSATITKTDSTGQLMTVTSAGSLTVAKDTSSPSYAIVAGGSTGVTLGVLKFSATNEIINLTKVALQLTNTASSSASDLTQVTLWDGSIQVGSVVFTGTNRNATSTLTTAVQIPKDGSKLITLKGNIASIGTAQPGTQGALIAVDYDNDDSTGTQGTGASSGTTINRTSSSDSAVAGVRVFKSYPTLAKIAIPSTILVTGTMDLYRFSITANPLTGNGIGLWQLTANIATSTGSAVSGTTTVTSMKVYAYTDSAFATPVSGYTNGQIVSTVTGLVAGNNDAELLAILQIPAGSTYYFKVTGDIALISGTGTFSGSVTTKINGDAAYPSLATLLMGTQTTIDADVNNNLVWSPNATTTSAAANVDWTNSYYVSGLPSDGMDSVTISK